MCEIFEFHKTHRNKAELPVHNHFSNMKVDPYFENQYIRRYKESLKYAQSVCN